MFGLRHASTGTVAGQAALMLMVGLVFALVIGIAQPAHGQCLPDLPNATAVLSEPGHAPASERAPTHVHHAVTHCHAAGASVGTALPGAWLDLTFQITGATVIAYVPRHAPAQHVLPGLKPPIA